MDNMHTNTDPLFDNTSTHKYNFAVNTQHLMLCSGNPQVSDCCHIISVINDVFLQDLYKPIQLQSNCDATLLINNPSTAPRYVKQYLNTCNFLAGALCCRYMNLNLQSVFKVRVDIMAMAFWKWAAARTQFRFYNRANCLWLVVSPKPVLHKLPSSMSSAISFEIFLIHLKQKEKLCFWQEECVYVS